MGYCGICQGSPQGGVAFLTPGRIHRPGRNREEYSLNNNRNNNNNRRGRGRNNRSQGGNPNQQNRIDSRARGNAPQMLDKYKKLAQDAQHNGDRVQMEYYLQFADHYFRVIADNKARQDEARGKRPDERGSEDYDDSDDDGEEGRRNPRRGREPRDQRDQRDDQGENDGYGRDNSHNHANGRARRDRDSDEGPRGYEGEDAADDFVRESKPKRKPRVSRKPSDDGEIDVAALPPAISASFEDEAPKPKRAPRRRKTGESAEAAAEA